MHGFWYGVKGGFDFLGKTWSFEVKKRDLKSFLGQNKYFVVILGRKGQF